MVHTRKPPLVRCLISLRVPALDDDQVMCENIHFSRGQVLFSTSPASWRSTEFKTVNGTMAHATPNVSHLGFSSTTFPTPMVDHDLLYGPQMRPS